VLLPFLWLALQSVRHIPLFCLLAAPLVAPLLGSLVRSPSAQGPARLDGLRTGFPAVALAFALILAAIQSVTVLAGTIRNRDLSAFRDFPTGAVGYLKEHPPRGNLFHEYDWGGYLIWSLPEVRTFVDGRMSYWEDRKKERDLFRDYLRIKGQRPDFEAILDRYAIGTCLIRSDTGLRTRLLTCAPWREVYHDTLASVLERVGEVPGIPDSTVAARPIRPPAGSRPASRSSGGRGSSSGSKPGPPRSG
jgi:hypothetical protein